MKRDMDLVRRIALALEQHPNGFAPNEIQIGDYTDEEIGYHIHLMIQAGLLEGDDVTCFGSKSP